MLNEIAAMLSSDENIERMVDTVLKAQSKESSFLAHLQSELNEVDKGIENILNAIQMGIVTASTKKRLEELESKRKELEIDIGIESISHRPLERIEVKTYFESYRKYDLSKQEHKRKLINSFVERIMLYDDKLIIVFFNGDKNIEVSLDSLDEIGNGTVADVLSRHEEIGEPIKAIRLDGFLFFAYCGFVINAILLIAYVA